MVFANGYFAVALLVLSVSVCYHDVLTILACEMRLELSRQFYGK